MESLNAESLARLDALNGGELPRGGGGDGSSHGGYNFGGPGKSGAGIDVASIYTHSVLDGEYQSYKIFTDKFLTP